MKENQLVWEIYAVDKNDWTHFSLIGSCFNKGLAKAWVESCITCDNFMLKSRSTGETLLYDSKAKKWK